MDVLFMGSGRFALPSLEKLLSKHRVLAVVTQPDRPRGRGRRTGPTPVKDFAAQHDLHLYQPEDVNEAMFQREIRALAPAVVVVAAYGQKISDELLQLPQYSCVNVHASLLPRHRGATPIARAIMSGDRLTGVTICRMLQKLDAGPIYAQRETEILPEETTPELEARLAPLGAEALLDVLEALEKGTAKETPQQESKVTIAKRFRKEDGRIPWNRPARRIHDMVRALQPFPRAFTFRGREPVTIYRTKPIGGSKGGARPGTLASGGPADLRVACGDGEVAILELQPAGKRRMGVEEYLNGRPLAPGESFR